MPIDTRRKGQCEKMITPKRRRILAIAAFLLLLYILRLKMAEPYTEIARLEDIVYELKRRNVLKLLHDQTMNSPTESNPNQQESSDLSSNGATQLHLPNIIDIYPHLVETKELESLNPALRYPDKRMPRKELIMGVPTIQRGNVSYLVPTLEQLLQKARIEDLDKIRIIVMISDVKGASSKFVQDTLTTLKDRFNDHFESGLLQVIVPPASWYPDITSLTPTFNDKPERMYWRTKQNLDYAYLMIYAARMGKLYLQLEDDIEAAADYTYAFSAKTFFYGTVLKYAERSEWFIIELSTLGYIGKLMRSKDIPSLAVHVLLNYQYKPIDWLLHDYCTNRYCSPEMASKVCAKEVAKHRQQVKPGMFQHVGYYSSLEGKIQKLKDKSFGVNFEPLKRESIWHGGKLRKEEIEKVKF
ncbi:hypothetical protein PRIPAC_97206 [Pristionchus pacificus]|uniref:MGAT4 conserved region domain-containing protein n=1 Tax=Pristionchus pacificus TaxID=54126 RepID=A0A2A6B2F4_PRIPA|nr:hypothetical protein PRIPAC_97206 [Pristionchus pacificus]|eukprot:PDM60052.1 hypothetical protein PRIPAC_49338 [Pristionchus pacificus]